MALRRIYRRRRLGALSYLSPSDIALYASNAGFTGNDLQTAVAIALAESNPPGNPNSYNAETAAPGGTPAGKGSYGLWQIYLKAHPEFTGQNLFDPQTNANAAYSIYSRRGGFSDWTTYTSGKYQAFLSQAPISAPITIDAGTGQVVDDSTVVPVSAGLSVPPLVLGLTIAAAGAYIFSDLSDLFD